MRRRDLSYGSAAQAYFSSTSLPPLFADVKVLPAEPLFYSYPDSNGSSWFCVGENSDHFLACRQFGREFHWDFPIEQ